MAIRVTNNMILNNSSRNINNTKVTLDKTNTQMTTQQKISRPSEDPVVAVRSLRLQTSASKTDQYYEKNIPDARSWLEVTESALTNIKDIITDIRTLCVRATTDTLTQDDRNTILTQLKSYQEEIYKEGNADYAGRTVFTGYRTDKPLTFIKDESETTYEITQKLSASNMTISRYYANDVKAPTTPNEVLDLGNGVDAEDVTTRQSDYYRLRTGYNDIKEMGVIDFGARGAVDLTGAGNASSTAVTGGDGSIANVWVFDSEAEWETWSEGQGEKAKYISDNDVIIIKQTGDIAYGTSLAHDMMSDGTEVSITYTKTGFKNGELRPEYYYDCKDISDPANPVEFKKYDDNGEAMGYDIKYTIAQNQNLAINTEASTVFDTDIYQDMSDLIAAMTKSVEAHDKVGKLKAMKSDPNYNTTELQAKLEKWIDLAQKEADYADDNIQKMYTEQLSKQDTYLAKINLGITKVGCQMDQLTMTEKRMSESQASIEDLQSQNDDLDLSQIVIDYTAIYTAYQSSLTAAGKLYQQTLLNYI